MEQEIYLKLQDGSYFTGKPFGAPLKEDRIAEVVFTTATTGYVETLTDPSYCGQMVVAAFPLVGNYGINPADFESEKIHMSAYIVGDWCRCPSNFKSRLDLDTFLKAQQIPGIYGLDTRKLIKRIREYGVMNGQLTHSHPAIDSAPTLAGRRMPNPVKAVTTPSPYRITSALSFFHVAVWDFGVKQNILRSLCSLNCDLTVLPADTDYEKILALSPDGILLSNGPGDPKENVAAIRQLSLLCKTGIPIFGICLGHQLLALAKGADTAKLKYGHRGANQPVYDRQTGRCYITSQNHGYTVKSETLPSKAVLRFTNLNDGTCEGIRYQDFPGLSVQFHPEACGGPKDTAFLFREFVSMMERRKSSCL